MVGVEMMLWLDKNYGPSNYGIRLQDFSDDQIKDFITKNQIKSKEDLFAGLRDKVADRDPEVLAHVLGFRCAADRQRLLAKIAEEQAKMKEV